jgi:FkbM family methyltransferase
MPDLVGSLEQIIATSQIHGLEFTLQKVKDRVLVESGLGVENTVLPVIRRLAESHHYATYVDVGAYDGDTLIPVAKFFDHCLALEPHPESFKRLQDNLKRHGIRNTTAIRCAIGSEISEQVLHLAERDDNSSLRHLDSQRGEERVKVLTLDNVLAEVGFPSPYLLKIDVEGGEFHVLLQGVRTLGADCAIVTELWPYALKMSGTPATQYVQLLKTHGYSPFNFRLQPISWATVFRFTKMWVNHPRVVTSLVFRRSKSQTNQSVTK